MSNTLTLTFNLNQIYDEYYSIVLNLNRFVDKGFIIDNNTLKVNQINWIAKSFGKDQNIVFKHIILIDQKQNLRLAVKSVKFDTKDDKYNVDIWIQNITEESKTPDIFNVTISQDKMVINSSENNHIIDPSDYSNLLGIKHIMIPQTILKCSLSWNNIMIELCK